MPRVSICIPAFNRPLMLLDALRCALRQTFRDIEVLVVHDGENTTVRDAVAAINDPRLRFFVNPVPLGVPGNWNQCVRQAKGEFVQIHPDDDALSPDFVSCAVAALDCHETVGFVQTGGFACNSVLRPAATFTLQGQGGFYSGVEALEWQFKHHYCMPISLLFRRTALEAEGFWRCDYLDDWATIFKIAYRHGFVYIDKSLCGLRVHSDNYSRRLRKGGRDGIGDVLNQYLDVFGSCLPTTPRLCRLLSQCLKEIGRKSAKASLRALANGHFVDAKREWERAMGFSPAAYLGPGILASWLKGSPLRKMQRAVTQAKALNEDSLFG
jgi:glycosyltransferase involved in cell wall biosynthesis